MKIVVVGAGVSGLTCAVALLEASRGDAEVVVLTAGAPAGTVSAVAGAMLGPVFGSGDARSMAWERRSDLVFRELARDPATGVRLLAGRLLAARELGPGLPPWVEQVPGYRSALSGSQLPPGFVSGFAAELRSPTCLPTSAGWPDGSGPGRADQQRVVGIWARRG
jgi:D-amino-acid oxidase